MATYLFTQRQEEPEISRTADFPLAFEAQLLLPT